MKYLLPIALALIVFGCSQNPDPKDSKDSTESNNGKSNIAAPIESEDELTVIKGHTFIQYYPGKKNIKFKGVQDDEHRRHGLWTYYSEDGKELSTTMFKHGMKDGHMIVKRENGAIHYYGEMQEDKKVGIWKTYDENGELASEKDFGPKK